MSTYSTEDDMPMKAEELGGKLKRSHSESSIIELLPKKQRLQSSDSEKEKGPLQVKDLFKVYYFKLACICLTLNFMV